MLNVRDNEGFTNYSAVKGWDYKQKWRTNTADLPRKFASSCANFFRSVRGLSREKIGIYEYSERVFCCNFFFFHDVIVNFEPTRQALYPTWSVTNRGLLLRLFKVITVYPTRRAGTNHDLRRQCNANDGNCQYVALWTVSVIKGKFLSWPWKWLIVPLISDPWDYFNGISSCSSFATQQSIIDKKNKRSISRRC